MIRACFENNCPWAQKAQEVEDKQIQGLVEKLEEREKEIKRLKWALKNNIQTRLRR